MNITQAKEWSKRFATFKTAKENCIPKHNTENTIKAIKLGFQRVCYRMDTPPQWSANIPSKSVYEQIMLRVEDGKLFLLKRNILIDWARRFEADAEIINL